MELLLVVGISINWVGKYKDANKISDISSLIISLSWSGRIGHMAQTLIQFSIANEPTSMFLGSGMKKSR